MHGLFVRDLQTPAQSKFRGVSVDQRAEAVRPALRGRVLQDMQCMIVISDLGGPYRVVSGHHPILPVIGDDARPGDVNDVPRVVDSQVGDARILARPMADATTGEWAALAVFSNERWRPVVLGRETGLPQQYAFREIGRGILYLPVLTDGQSVRPAGRPFRLDPRGNLQYHEPDTDRLVTIDLTSLLLPKDLETLDTGRLYVAYWTPKGWRDCEHPIDRSFSAMDGKPVYTVAGVPDGGIYCLFDKHSGRTYHRRIFRNGQGTARRF